MDRQPPWIKEEEEELFPSIQQLVGEEEVKPEMQEWSLNLIQGDQPDPSHIKDEQEDVRNIEFTLIPVILKSEDEEKPQCSELYQINQMKTDTEGETYQHLEPNYNDKTEYSEPETDDSEDWKETREPQSGLNTQKKNKLHGNDSKSEADEKPFHCLKCGERFARNFNLKRHSRTHTGEKPFVCSVCGKSYKQAGHLKKHMSHHTGKTFSCTVCAKSFTWHYQLKKHKCGGESSQANKIWTSQDEEQFQDLEVAGINMSSAFLVTREYEEKPQSSQLHQTEPIQTGGDDYGGRETDIQQLSVRNERLQAELQEWSLILIQEDPPESPHNKENEEEVWTSQFTFTPVTMKNEDEEKPQGSELYQTELIKTDADGEVGRHLQPAYDKAKDSEPPTESSKQWNEIKEVQTDFKFWKNDTLFSDSKCEKDDKPFCCSKCCEIFFCSSNLKRPIRTLTEERPFVYSVCGKSCKQAGNLTGEKRFSCTVCHRSFTLQYPLKKQTCGGDSSQIHTFWTNQDGEHPQELKDADINKIFPISVRSEDLNEEKHQSALYYTEHMTGGGGDRGGPERSRNSDPKILLHPDSGKNTEDPFESSTTEHLREARSPQPCLNPLKMKVGHDTERNRISESGEKPFKCSVCGSAHSRKDNLFQHMRLHTGKKPYCCSICSKSFSRNRNFQSHMRTHTGERPFSCPVCGKRFTQKHHMRFHVKGHTGEKPHSCSLCNKRYIHPGDLKRHMRTHTGERFSCSLCEKSFAKQSYIQVHMRTHTGERPFRCSVCGKTFTQNGLLQTHLKRHTGEKPYCCSICKKQFVHKTHLHRHTKTHTGEKPFSCYICSKRFTQKYHLRFHVKAHEGEKLHSCTHCSKNYLRKAQLQRHMKNHSLEKPCSNPFSTRLAWPYQFNRPTCGDESSPNGEHHQELEVTDKVTLIPASGKSDDEDEKKPNSSKFHQTEQIGTVQKHHVGPEAGQNLQPDTNDKTENYEDMTHYSEAWMDTEEPQIGVNSQNNRYCASDKRCKTDEKPFGCTECGARFTCNFNLKTHLRTHTGEKPFICSVCGKSYKQAGHLKKHMTHHTGEKRFSCNVCEKIFTWQFQLKMHKCAGESSQLHKIWTNQKTEHFQELEVGYNTMFTPIPVKGEDDEDKPNSSQLHQTEEMQNDGEEFEGPEPGGNSESDRHLQPDTDKKREGSSGSVIADDQRETKWPQSRLNAPINNVNSNTEKKMSSGRGEKTFKCSVCGSGHSRRDNLLQHMRLHTGEKPYSCSICNKGFRCKRDTQRHMEIHTRDTSKAIIKPYDCSECGKAFRRKENLVVHMRSHTGEKPYSCSVCKKHFRYKGNVKTHMKIHTRDKFRVEAKLHSELVKRFNCSECGRKYCRKNQLVVHMRTHSGEKPFSCSSCGKGFTQKYSLQIHLRGHTGDKPHSCSLCNMRYSQDRDLKRHMRTHTGERFSCSICKKTFSRRCYVQVHMRNHTGEKPFRCSVCGKDFAQNYRLQTHLKTHIGEKTFSCSVCDKGFVQNIYLRRHMRTHTGEKPFNCSVCSKSFSWKHHLRFHFRSHTGEKNAEMLALK